MSKETLDQFQKNTLAWSNGEKRKEKKEILKKLIILLLLCKSNWINIQFHVPKENPIEYMFLIPFEYIFKIPFECSFFGSFSSFVAPPASPPPKLPKTRVCASLRKSAPEVRRIRCSSSILAFFLAFCRYFVAKNRRFPAVHEVVERGVATTWSACFLSAFFIFPARNRRIL